MAKDIHLSDLGVTYQQQQSMLAYLRTKPGFKVNIITGGRRQPNKIIVDETLKDTIVNAFKRRSENYEYVYYNSTTYKAVQAVLNHFGMQINDIPIIKPDVAKQTISRERNIRESLAEGQILVKDIVPDNIGRRNLFMCLRTTTIYLPILDETNRRPNYYMTKELWNSKYKGQVLDTVLTLPQAKKEALMVFYYACEKQFNQKEIP